jgi:hypothetical protein
MDLSAQKLSSPFQTLLGANVGPPRKEVNEKMDIGLLAAAGLLVVWAVFTFIVNDAPGVIHALLIAGVTLLVWRVVKRDAPPGPGTPPQK